MPQIPAPADARRQEKLKAFDRLLTIMDELRLNCPWDKKQTLESLRHLTIEETYELSDAILEGDLDEVRKELGDLMLHMAFYSRIGQEKGAFDMADVLNGVCEKLIHRHPHIYGDVVADSEEAVKANWEKIKLQEKGSSEEFKSVLAGVPQSLPALVKAMRMQEKARGVGFDWEQPEQVWDKVEEELHEFHAEAEAHRQQPSEAQAKKLQGEFGDVLFSLINYARFLKLNPEEALERTNKKFLKRFQHLERQAHANGKELSDMTLAEMDVYWEEAKGLE